MQTKTWFFLLILAMGACSDSNENNALPLIPTAPNNGMFTNNGTTTPNNNGTLNNGKGSIINAEGVVPLDLADFLSDEGDVASKVYQVDDPSQLLEGPVALGQVGDYILENDEVKFLIEGDTRNMNPCPWGGNVLDAAVKKGEAPNLDILGEVCHLLNASFTLKPEKFEMAQFGKTSVLAVGGRLTIGDFINIKSMIGDLAPALANAIKVDTETIPDVDMTVYYILRPGDHGVRVISAFENTGEEQVDLAAIHLMASGGDGYYFNPVSENKGFGIPAGLTISAAPFPFLVFNGDKASYALVPEPVERLQGSSDLPIGGAYLVFAGVAAAMLQETNVLTTIVTPERLAAAESVLHVQKGEVQSYTHWIFAGDGSISSILDHGYETIGVKTAKVSGKVVDADGNAMADARVVGIFEGATYSQTKSKADGSFEMELPQGRSYELYARFGNRPSAGSETINLGSEPIVTNDLKLVAASKIVVNITDGDGKPTPGRISVICDGECVGFKTLNDADVEYHRLPSVYGDVHWTGIDGKGELELPGGHDYRVVVSRGMEWSTWPAANGQAAGLAFTLDVGETETFNAEIMKVVETPNSISSDFHIHTIASSDSTVEHEERVLNFMAEGVDVIVTTDHDIITDFGPSILALNAENEIASMIGEEVTTSDLGHFNVFPVEKDDTKTRRGGAVDWGGAEGPALDPADLFEAMNAFPGEQVVQVNHAANLGLVNGTTADVLRKTSLGNRAKKRLPEKEDGPGGDTGLWTDGFTAMELMNGNSQEGFWVLAHWWFTMIGRGFVPTGTAVSDTHKKYSDLGGVPRTYVFIDGMNDAKSFDEASFVNGVNGGSAIGTNGPFFTVVATNSAGAKVGPGSIIEALGNDINVEVNIQVPEWIDVDTVDYYFNPDPAEVIVEAGKTNDTPITPTGTINVNFAASDIMDLQGSTATHKLKSKTVNFTINSAVDGYLVVIVKGTEQMFPVLLATPFAFSNPIIIDGDGNGYDNPPLAALANTPVQPRARRPRVFGSQLDAAEEVEMDIHEIERGLGSILHDLTCQH